MARARCPARGVLLVHQARRRPEAVPPRFVAVLAAAVVLAVLPYAVGVLLPCFVDSLHRLPLAEVASGAHDPEDTWPQGPAGGLVQLAGLLSLALTPLALGVVAAVAVCAPFLRTVSSDSGGTRVHGSVLRVARLTPGVALGLAVVAPVSGWMAGAVRPVHGSCRPLDPLDTPSAHPRCEEIPTRARVGISSASRVARRGRARAQLRVRLTVSRSFWSLRTRCPSLNSRTEPKSAMTSMPAIAANSIATPRGRAKVHPR